MTVLIQHRNILGKMQDGCRGVPISNLVNLKSKMYFYIRDNQKRD